MRHATVVSFIMMCNTGYMAQGNGSLQRQCADPFDNQLSQTDMGAERWVW